MGQLAFQKVWGGSGLTALWQRAKKDDSVVFEELVSRHQERFYRVAYRMTGSHEDAQDLLQEALIEAFKAFGRFSKGSYFDKWLFRIMTRTFIASRRVKVRTPVMYLEEMALSADSGERRAYEIADYTDDPLYKIQQRTLAEPIQAALDSLPANFKIVLVLADIEQLSYDEIADMLECPVGTVRSRLHRARSIMLKQLKTIGHVLDS